MITLLLIAAAIIGVVIITFGWGVGLYNMIIMAQQMINNQWSNVKTEYQRRADLLYNLAGAVKSHKEFEQDTFIHIAEARNGNFGKGKDKEMQTLKGLDGFFSKLIATYENYPQLKSSELYAKLMDENKMTENRVNIARTDYNELVRDYNILITTFPNLFVARMFNCKEQVFFEVDDKAYNKAPRLFPEMDGRGKPDDATDIELVEAKN